jgi:hypothetical protein
MVDVIDHVVDPVVFVLGSVFKEWMILVVCSRFRDRREAIGSYLVPVYQCSDCFDQKRLELDTCGLPFSVVEVVVW